MKGFLLVVYGSGSDSFFRFFDLLVYFIIFGGGGKIVFWGGSVGGDNIGLICRIL